MTDRIIADIREKGDIRWWFPRRPAPSLPPCSCHYRVLLQNTDHYCCYYCSLSEKNITEIFHHFINFWHHCVKMVTTLSGFHTANITRILYKYYWTSKRILCYVISFHSTFI